VSARSSGCGGCWLGCVPTSVIFRDGGHASKRSLPRSAQCVCVTVVTVYVSRVVTQASVEHVLGPTRRVLFEDSFPASLYDVDTERLSSAVISVRLYILSDALAVRHAAAGCCGGGARDEIWKLASVQLLRRDGVEEKPGERGASLSHTHTRAHSLSTSSPPLCLSDNFLTHTHTRTRMHSRPHTRLLAPLPSRDPPPPGEHWCHAVPTPCRGVVRLCRLRHRPAVVVGIHCLRRALSGRYPFHFMADEAACGVGFEAPGMHVTVASPPVVS
jgi:hypothetical protein